MDKKFSLSEIKEMLLEPSFDFEAQMLDVFDVRDFIMVIEEAIAHHEKLNKSNNGEGF